MSEEMISRRDFLACIGATLGLAAVAAIAVAPVTASASSAKAADLPAAAACSKCHVSALCDEDCATCPENQNKPADK
jgi:anaerobic selenocysteine-containing dehydrogenase